MKCGEYLCVCGKKKSWILKLCETIMDADYSDHTPSVKSLWSLTSEVKTVALLVKKIKPMVLIRLFILYKSWPAVWSSSRFTWGREDPRHVRTTMEPRCKSQMEARGRPPFKPRKIRSCDSYCFVFCCRGWEVLLDNSRISRSIRQNAIHNIPDKGILD